MVLSGCPWNVVEDKRQNAHWGDKRLKQTHIYQVEASYASILIFRIDH